MSIGAAWQRCRLHFLRNVLAQVPKGSAEMFYALTTTCERFDVISEPVSKLASTPLSRRIVVFDKDDLNRLIPPPNDPPPNVTAITYLIEETLRQAANFPTVIVRQDWLLGVIAVQQVQLFLYELFAESNKPMPPTGPKQWSFKLTARQRHLLEALPVAAPAERSVNHAREAAFTLFFAEIPAIAKSNGIAWPHELEAAVRAYVISAGLPLPAAGRTAPCIPAARRPDYSVTGSVAA